MSETRNNVETRRLRLQAWRPPGQLTIGLAYYIRRLSHSERPMLRGQAIRRDDHERIVRSSQSVFTSRRCRAARHQSRDWMRRLILDALKE